MKALFFLRCGVVIGLSLFAGRAGAQSDSLIINLHFFGHNHSRGISTQSTNGHGPVAGPYEYISVDSTHDFIFKAGENDTINDTTGDFTWVYFIIDGDSLNFRSCSLEFFSSGSYSNGDGGWGADYKIVFDSISFLSNGIGSVFATGLFPASYNVSGGAQGDYSNEPYMGSFNTIGLEEDSLYIEIGPASALVAGNIHESSSPLRIEWNNSMNEVSANFSIFDSPRIFEIIDMLGRTVASFSLPSEAQSLQLPIASISPGLYFARLGDQVAKFVVPPR